MRTLTARQSYLHLLLEALGVEVDISSIESRIKMQKYVYVQQMLTSVPKLYEFRWDTFGPYSGQLADDYHVLHGFVFPLMEGVFMPDEVRSEVRHVASKLAKSAIDLKDHAWLELLGSTLFLILELKYSVDEVEAAIKDDKPELAPYLPMALEAISQFVPTKRAA